MKIEIEKPIVPVWFDKWYKTFEGNKTNALYFLNRTGWGNALTDNNNVEIEDYAGKLKAFSDSDGYIEAQEYLSKAILYGYEVKSEPFYYAKIKGWEHVGTSSYFFGYDEENDSLEITYFDSNYRFAFLLTKEHWNKLGIDDSNADFEEA